MLAIVSSLLLILNLAISLPLDTPQSCSSCHPLQEGKLNVHLVPHSHNDVGWIRTIDEYYYGTSPYIGGTNTAVQIIINSVIGALQNNADRRFSQVEIAFFWKWWQDKNTKDESKKILIDLINSGQMEIVNGALTMNDEATTNYQEIIDDFTWGFRILNDTVGECAIPKIGWQIDPFGHSREHASLMKQLGFDGLVLGRITAQDKRKRIEEQNLDFLWKSSVNLEGDVDIFTTMFPHFYVADEGFTFDVSNPSGRIIDDKNSPFYNLDSSSYEFSKLLEMYRKYYKTSNLMLPMGGDFTYQAAEINYSNLDRLIGAFKDDERYNVFYSTPSCYVKAARDEVAKKNISLTQKSDDFFPYAMDDYVFWAGFFSSRPNFKRNERIGNNILQATKQLATFSKNTSDDSINPLREIIGVLQHHDAITGTEKQLVSQDYMRLLFKALKGVENTTSDIVNSLLKKDSEDFNLDLKTCLLANVSICEASTNDRFLVVIYNPLSRSVSHYVRLPVNHTAYRIQGPDGEEIFDVFEIASDYNWMQEVQQPSPFEIVFKAKNLPPFGIKLYFVERVAGPIAPVPTVTDETIFGTETNGFTIQEQSGRLTSITLNSHKTEVTQSLLNYVPASYSPLPPVYNDRLSGAYVFNPEETPESLTTESSTVRAAKGKLVDEVIFNYNSNNTNLIQTIRVYKDPNENYVEFEWIVGNLPDVGSFWTGSEIINRFTINGFNSSGIFYTDSNGREQIRRVRGNPGDYDYDPSIRPVSGNYYPITSKIVLKDISQNLQVAILNDRAQGGSSLTDDSVELMVHRRLLYDENLGVSETLDEYEYDKGVFAKGHHYFLMGDIDSAASHEKDLAQKIFSSPRILVADATRFNNFGAIQNVFNLEFAGLTRNLPRNVKILTLEPWKDQTYLLRLEHTFEKGEDSVLSVPVTIDLENLFTLFDISDIIETSLGANIFPEVMKPTLKITLNPMEIRTFLITINFR